MHDTPDEITASNAGRRFGLVEPLVALALPFILFYPYLWLVFKVGRAAIDQHLPLDAFAFWDFTYPPLCAICFLVATVKLIRLARGDVRARWLLVPASLLALAALGIVVLGVLMFLV